MRDQTQRDAVEEVRAITLAKLARDYPSGPALRCQHAKGFAVRGDLVVGAMPAALRHGVLSAPGRYRVVVRLSSSNPKPQCDAIADARGMAIKVLDVPDGWSTETRDWDIITATGRAFFARDARDAVALAQRMSEGRVGRYFLPGLNPAGWRLLAFRNAWEATHQRVEDPLDAAYDSQVPFALGPHIVRYVVLPGDTVLGRRQRTPDGLRDVVESHLAAFPATLRLLVQIAPTVQGALDPRHRWSRRRSPLQHIATITLPRQAPMPDEDAERLSFNPGNAPREHRALGAINGLREVVYAASAGYRGASNIPARSAGR